MTKSTMALGNLASPPSPQKIAGPNWLVEIRAGAWREAADEVPV